VIWLIRVIALASLLSIALHIDFSSWVTYLPWFVVSFLVGAGLAVFEEFYLETKKARRD